MPAPFPKPRDGKPVKNHPTGFPLFFDRRKTRVVTADPWAFLRHLAVTRLDRERERRAVAYINQAFDFFEAAKNPQVGSKPLLYYYSFLNLAKAGLIIRKVKLPAAARHGISDPRANIRTRLRIAGQKVRVEAKAADHSKLFAEFVALLGGSVSRATDFKIVELLGQVPGIHRTFLQVSKKESGFVPVERVEALHSKGQVWVRLVFRRGRTDVEALLPVLKRRSDFRMVFSQVKADNASEAWFESQPVPGRKRGVDNAIRQLARSVRRLGCGATLTNAGYRFYVPARRRRERLPYLAVPLALVFYLGSVVRYKPDVFDKILAGGYAWVVEEFLATQPIQFVYALASELAGVDVVRPYAVIE